MFMVIEHLTEPEMKIPRYETYEDEFDRVSSNTKKSKNSIWTSELKRNKNRKRLTSYSNFSAMTVMGPGLRNTIVSQDGMIKYHFGIIDYLQDWNF